MSPNKFKTRNQASHTQNNELETKVFQKTYLIEMKIRKKKEIKRKNKKSLLLVVVASGERWKGRQNLLHASPY